MSDESVKVAVRVRPFNQREIDRNAKLTIEMQTNMTIITNPENPTDKKTFSFDYSYWSHDGSKEDNNGVLIPDSPESRYASQKIVFDDLGQSVLENAFQGYNCSLFAYGQTGSGKSYSMIGYGPNKGIVPVICDELFKRMATQKQNDLRYEVSLSMLEIYNENVRDLLTKDPPPKGGLPIRQTPYQGFYVQGLKKVPVGSYKEIESRMDQGTSNRTVAMTNMNATSSRAHTVVIITFDQITRSNNTDIRKSSVMNLVDLAGSERADSTGATGDRLKEGANINKSLSALGNVISALADVSNGKKKIVVPYRDSVLTKLLQNALGGNSKTVMIAALSPADINYDETLSTLRYADRAKQIKNKAIVNENPMDKILRELKEENDKLRLALSSGNLPQTINTQGLTQDEIFKMRQEIMDELKAQLNANSEVIEAEDPRNWKTKLEEARKEVAIIAKEEKVGADKRSKVAHLINLNEDPQLSGVIVHYLDDSKMLITRLDDNLDSSDDDEDSDTTNQKVKSKSKHKKNIKKNEESLKKITLKGLSISNRHAIIERKGNNDYTIRPGLFGAQTKVNGNLLSTEVDLHDRDRVLFGSHHLYLFINPLNKKTGNSLTKLIDWEYAQNEIAHIDGFETENIQGMTKDQQIVQQQILEIIPMIAEVNAISEELKKFKKFETILVPPNAQDSAFGSVKQTRLMVKISDTMNGNAWYWERGKFMNRRYLMQELYQRFLEDGLVKQIENNSDPFWEPAEELLLGTANVFLQSLGYNLDFDDKIPILNYEGQEEGFINVRISPSTANGRVLDDDSFVDNPQLLLTRTYHFLVTVSSVDLHNPKYTKGTRVRYRVFKDEKSVETELIKNTRNVTFNHNKVFSFARITQDHLDFFDHGYITFRIYVNQEDTDVKNLITNNQEAHMVQKYEKHRLSVMPVPDFSDENAKLKSDLSVLSRKLERLEQRNLKMKTLCHECKLDGLDEVDYEGFYRAIKGLLFCGQNRKFKASEMVVGQVATYSRNKANIGEGGLTGYMSSNNSSHSNPNIKESIPEEDEFYPLKKKGSPAASENLPSSKACSVM